MPRLFVAIDIPEAVRKELSRLPRPPSGARAVPESQIHLTLRFIGDVDPDTAELIREALAKVHAIRFTMELAGGGTFPPHGDPRVLWVGVAQSVELLALQKAVEIALVDLGLEPEDKPFRAHITLARMRGTRRSALARTLEALGPFRSGPIAVDHFCLYSSVLGRDGATHTVEREYGLESPVGP